MRIGHGVQSTQGIGRGEGDGRARAGAVCIQDPAARNDASNVALCARPAAQQVGEVAHRLGERGRQARAVSKQASASMWWMCWAPALSDGALSLGIDECGPGVLALAGGLQCAASRSTTATSQTRSLREYAKPVVSRSMTAKPVMAAPSLSSLESSAGPFAQGHRWVVSHPGAMVSVDTKGVAGAQPPLRVEGVEREPRGARAEACAAATYVDLPGTDAASITSALCG